MNILVLSLENPCSLKSGAGRYLKNQLELLKDDIMFTVCTLRPEESCFENSDGAWKTIEIPLKFGACASFEDALAEMNFQMIKKVLEFAGRFDLIHANDDVTAPAAFYLKHALQLPLISTIHGLESDRKKAAGEKAHPYRMLLERLILKESRRVIVLSSMMKQAIKEKSSHAAENVQIIPNPCRKTKTAKKQLKAVPYLFSYGRFVPEKGFFRLLRTFKELAMLQPDLELVIAGEGPLKSEYEKEAKTLGIERRVTILPFICDQERESWLAYSEMAAFPSAYEPFGIAVQESMTAGVPVAAGKNGGWNDFVIDRVTGFRVDFENPCQAARTLDDLLRSEAIRRKVKQTGQAFIWQLHNPEKIRKLFLERVYTPSF